MTSKNNPLGKYLSGSAGLSPEEQGRLLAEIENLLVTVPEDLVGGGSENAPWLGRLKSTISTWDPMRGSMLGSTIRNLGSPLLGEGADTELLVALHEARHDLQMRTGRSLNAAISTGEVYEYFEAIRKVILTAQTDVLVVDRYLDASFVSSYIVHARTAARVRLLSGGKYLAQLTSAVDAYARQTGASIEIRSTLDFHDRYIFIDRRSCYQSGASFRDGGRLAPTTLTQIIDTFDVVLRHYESIWESSKPSPGLAVSA